MDFWARGAFHRARRLAQADAAPNVVRKAVRHARGRKNQSEHPASNNDMDVYVPCSAIVGPNYHPKTGVKQ